MTTKVLIGNAFSFTLFRGHSVKIEEISLDDFTEVVKEAEIFSFWGHENSRLDAESYLRVRLSTKVERPTIELSDKGYPMLYGETFKTCYVLSPDYVQAYRPAIGTEVPTTKISGWHLLRLTWQD